MQPRSLVASIKVVSVLLNIPWGMTWQIGFALLYDFCPMLLRKPPRCFDQFTSGVAPQSLRETDATTNVRGLRIKLRIQLCLGILTRLKEG
jgi:hypothetical protein